jgi:hypothetical protein
LDRLPGQGEAEAGHPQHLQVQAAVGDLRLDRDGSQRSHHFQRARRRVRGDPADQTADQRDHAGDRLLDTVGGPGDVGVQRTQRAGGLGGLVHPDVIEAQLQLHALGFPDLVAGGLHPHVPVMVTEMLQ